MPEPPSLGWRTWAGWIGPGIVMMGIQIGGGEWLFGPEITVRYGGGLLWVATIAIVLQVFYNLECGRYALYCGEPMLTGFMRLPPGPRFWIGAVLVLNAGALIPGLSTHGAAILAALILDRPPGEEDRVLVRTLAYVCLLGVALPVLVGGKVYRMLQAVMTAKVFGVLGFCLVLGIGWVSWENWGRVASGFGQFGTVPVADGRGGETAVNVFGFYWEHGAWPAVSLANIAVLGAFAGYAGGGGLANSTYSNFVRDQGWGMGQHVGAIPSAIGGKQISLSHIGRAFTASAENQRRWQGWWRRVAADQWVIWAPGCFMGMGLPALLSLQFGPHSPLAASRDRLEWAQALVTADGLRHAPEIGPWLARGFWLAALIAGLAVMLPSQMSIVDDFSRRWTDAIWSGSARVRSRLRPNQVHWIYYSLLFAYVLWSLIFATWFTTPKLMTIVIANLNNLALGTTSFVLIWMNHRLLPRELRPRWYSTLGVLCCGVFYLGLAILVAVEKQLPYFVEFWRAAGG